MFFNDYSRNNNNNNAAFLSFTTLHTISFCHSVERKNSLKKCFFRNNENHLISFFLRSEISHSLEFFSDNYQWISYDKTNQLKKRPFHIVKWLFVQEWILLVGGGGGGTSKVFCFVMGTELFCEFSVLCAFSSATHSPVHR